MKNNNFSQYNFFVLVNNFVQFEKNTQLAINNLKKNNNNVFLHTTDNTNSQYKSIRQWINAILTDIYLDSEKYVNSWVFFTHQDTYFPNNFIHFFKRKINNIDFESIGLFGFAGIDKEGDSHKYILDSGSFSFSYDFDPVVVDSVDEFVFGINVSVFIEHKIFLSKLVGWHAYAAEFSIILQQLGYATLFLPVFVEHNSIRTNNSNIAQTHQCLFKLYGKKIKTLVGGIEYKSIYKILLLNTYSFYVNFLKYSFLQKILENLKILLIGKIPFYSNAELLLNQFITKKSNIEIFVISNCKDYVEEQVFKVKKTTVSFKILSNINDIKSEKDDAIIVLGVNYKIDGFSYKILERINYKIN